MPRQYNLIYKELVQSEDDVVGHVAYSLYKEEKRQFMESWYKENPGAQDIPENELHIFHQASMVPNAIQGYRLQAQEVLNDFMNTVLKHTKADFEEEFNKKHEEHLENIVNKLVPGVWSQIWPSLVASFLFALLGATAVFIFKNPTGPFGIPETPKIEQTQQSK